MSTLDVGTFTHIKGNSFSGLKFLACSDYAKYVCNSMHIHSKCSDCCEFSADTDKIDVEEEEGRGCCS